MYVLDRNKYTETTKQSLAFGGNPYRRKRRVKDDDKIPPEVTEKYVAQILDLVLYDVENNKAIADFEPVKMNTECIFALKSRIWGACDYDRSLSLGKNWLEETNLDKKWLWFNYVFSHFLYLLHPATEQNVTR